MAGVVAFTCNGLQLLSGANHSGHAEGTTKAGVSEGTLIVRDTGKQQQDVAVMQRAYDNAMRQYGTGSDLQKAAQAVTGALTALASGASPYLATEIKKRVGEDNIPGGDIFRQTVVR